MLAGLLIIVPTQADREAHVNIAFAGLLAMRFTRNSPSFDLTRIRSAGERTVLKNLQRTVSLLKREKLPRLSCAHRCCL